MTSSTKLDEKLEGADNFRAWSFRFMLIPREHDLDRFVEAEVPEPEDEEARDENMGAEEDQVLTVHTKKRK